MRVLRRGDAGEDVAEIRSMLSSLGLLGATGETDGHAVFDHEV
ncbi:MAG TPA: N-acetylmuramoyl-L-alanine amidase, partial [Amycolatopsis sp.]|nr:N-acetylmuramoyl-L-alanine amidase [Amycolatopsis sp.]